MFAEIVELKLGDGSIRRGQVLEVDGSKAIVQVPPPFTPDMITSMAYMKARELSIIHSPLL